MWEVEYTDEFGAWWDELDADEQESIATSINLLRQRTYLMAKNFRELEDKMRPEARERAKARAKEAMAQMLLAEIRKAVGLTQEEVAASLGIKQPTLSRLESQDDMHISTLRRLIEALGGQLEIIAHLPGGDIRLTQFQDAA